MNSVELVISAWGEMNLTLTTYHNKKKKLKQNRSEPEYKSQDIRILEGNIEENLHNLGRGQGKDFLGHRMDES